MLVSTVEENKEGFTNREVDDAKQMRQTLGLIGYQSGQDYKDMVRSSMIMNCPTTTRDIENDNTIFGRNVHTLKGITVRKQPGSVISDYMEIPEEIKQMNQDIELLADIMFLNGLPFLVTISRIIMFTTVEYLDNQSKGSRVKSIKKALKLY